MLSHPLGQREKTIKDVLELVGLSEKSGALIGALSRGMQQRLGLARVLIHDPALLLLDEPASGLDPRARIEVMAILEELQRMGKTIISSHILSELQNLCNRVAIIEKGKLIYTGPVQGVRDQFATGRIFWIKIAGSDTHAIDLLKLRRGGRSLLAVDGRLRVMLCDHDTDAGCLAETQVWWNQVWGWRKRSWDWRRSSCESLAVRHNKRAFNHRLVSAMEITAKRHRTAMASHRLRGACRLSGRGPYWVWPC